MKKAMVGLVLLLHLLFQMAPAVTWAGEAQAFTMGTDLDPASYNGIWLRQVFVEAFRRMGVPLRFSMSPVRRTAAELKAGEIDGTMVRTTDFGQAFPDLVRIDEEILRSEFKLYGSDPKTHLSSLEQVKEKGLRVLTRRGVILCGTILSQVLPAERISTVTTTLQGFKMLTAGRADVLCDIEASVDATFLENGGQEKWRVFEILTLNEKKPQYPYLHRRWAHLAPKLSSVLHDMKREGLIEKYKADARKRFK